VIVGGLEIRLLGPFEVIRDGQVVPLTSSRLRSVLASIAMSPGEVVSIDDIGTALWAGELPDDPRGSVQTYVARLRRLLGADVIVTEGSGYRLQIPPEDIDAHRFLRLAAVPQGDPDEYRMLSDALALWRGTPFEGVPSEWLAESEAARLVERYLTTFERRADLDLAAGNAAELVPELESMAAAYPLHEPLAARLIIALLRSGRRDEALAAYKTVRDRIVDELGVEPGPELRRLLTDDAEPESVPRQLPADIAHFTGRGDVLAELDGLAAAGGGPVVIAAMHGAGGVGKTAAAVHWAHRNLHRFPDGQLYIDLRGYGPGNPVAPATTLDVLLRDLGVRGAQVPDTVDGRSALLRSLLADRRMLLVLDNARNPEQVRPLLPGSSTMVLITSRNQLRGLVARDGARRVVVDEFTVAESVEFLATALNAHRTPYDVTALTDLAERCGHLPLALAIAAENSGRIDELGAGDLRTVFSWSVRTLDPGTARAFRLLGVHPGADLSTPAAAALFGTAPAAAKRLLDRLVEAHLLEQHRHGRYRMHDLLRAYAAETAAAGADATDATDATDAVARVVEFYVHTAANARIALGRGESLGETGDVPDGIEPLTFADDAEAFAWFDAERAVLVSTVEATGDYRLAEQMSSYLINRYAVDDLLNTQRIAIEAARRAGDVAAEAVAANKLGSVLRVVGDYEAALEHLEEALSLFASIGDDRGQATVLANLGSTLQAMHQLGQAVERHQQGLAIARRSGHTDTVVVVLNNLAMSYLMSHRHDEAVDACRQALDITSSETFRHVAPHLWDTLGQALAGRGSHHEALAAYETALGQVRELGDHWGEAIVLSNLGVVLRDLGRPDEARTSWQQALAVIDRHGIPDGQDFRRGDLQALIDGLATAAS
jgi:DNA-binding SARP family transcriptional activator/predicted negative regulator of RcsB-dependent stress response